MSTKPRLKIVELYQECLLKDGLDEDAWLQFFLLKPSKDAFERLITRTSTNLLFAKGKAALRELFKRSLDVLHKRRTHARQDVKGKGKELQNGEAVEEAEDDKMSRMKCSNAMKTIAMLLTCLSKKGLRDGEMVELVSDLEDADENFKTRDLEMQHQTVRFVVIVLAASPQSTIVARFMDKDLFELLVGLVETPFAYEALLALSLLCHHQRFEKQNLHVSLLAGLKAPRSMDTWIGIVGKTFERGVQAYDEIWNGPEMTSTMNSVRGWVGSLTKEEQHTRFNDLPLEECAVTLALYDLVYTNRLFSRRFIRQGFPLEHGGIAAFFSTAFPPVGIFLRHTSYLFSHVQNERSKYYARLMLIIILCMVEDESCANLLVQLPIQMDLCRHRAPFPPVAKPKERPLMCFILDTVASYINLNLKKRLDIDAYLHCATILHRILVHLKSTSTRLVYHWSFLFSTLVTMSKFLVAPANIEFVQTLTGYHSLVRSIITLFNLAVSFGDTFLPDAKSLDDLFYECLRHGPLLDKLGDMGGIAIRSGPGRDTSFAHPPGSAASSTGSTDVTNLRLIYLHFNAKIIEYQSVKQASSWIGRVNVWSKGRETTAKESGATAVDLQRILDELSAEQVLRVIQTSYDGLELKQVKGLESARKYLGGEVHEAVFFKSLLRHVISDIHALVPDVVITDG